MGPNFSVMEGIVATTGAARHAAIAPATRSRGVCAHNSGTNRIAANPDFPKHMSFNFTGKCLRCRKLCGEGHCGHYSRLSASRQTIRPRDALFCYDGEMLTARRL